jgi:hypothetical protein
MESNYDTKFHFFSSWLVERFKAMLLKKKKKKNKKEVVELN